MSLIGVGPVARINLLYDPPRFVSRHSGYFRPRANVSAADRLDCGENWPGCPLTLVGKAEAPIVVTTTLGAGEVWDGEPDDENGSLVDGEWRVPRPKRTKTSQEIADELAARKAEMKAQVSARFRALVAAGKVVSGTTIDITAEGFTRLEQARNVVPLEAVTARGEAIDLPDTATVDAILAAARAHYKAAVKRERALYDAVDAAADLAALALIDAEAGSISGSGSWPAS